MNSENQVYTDSMLSYDQESRKVTYVRCFCRVAHHV